MSPPPYPRGIEVTVHARSSSEKDRYGKEIPSWVDEIYEGCAVWFTAPAESVGRSDTVTVRAEAMLPKGAAVTALDEVTFNGLRCKVVGPPIPWRSTLTGTDVGIQVTLEAIR